jgi:hypothetical protein
MRPRAGARKSAAENFASSGIFAKSGSGDRAQGRTLDALPARPGQESIPSEVDGVPFVLLCGPSRAGEGRQAAARRLLQFHEVLRLIFFVKVYLARRIYGANIFGTYEQTQGPVSVHRKFLPQSDG